MPRIIMVLAASFAVCISLPSFATPTTRKEVILPRARLNELYRIEQPVLQKSVAECYKNTGGPCYPQLQCIAVQSRLDGGGATERLTARFLPDEFAFMVELPGFGVVYTDKNEDGYADTFFVAASMSFIRAVAKEDIPSKITVKNADLQRLYAKEVDAFMNCAPDVSF